MEDDVEAAVVSVVAMVAVIQAVNDLLQSRRALFNDDGVRRGGRVGCQAALILI